jgi:hypothetical protein
MTPARPLGVLLPNSNAEWKRNFQNVIDILPAATFARRLWEDGLGLLP